ncbi:MAG: roadblock/LC7 domain-containing protein [Candidatus Baldrarchaeia archaeon]
MLSEDVIKSILENLGKMEGVKGVVITTTEGIPVHSTFPPDVTEKISAFAASLLGKAKEMIKEVGGAKVTFITLDTSEGELLISSEQEYVIAILR